jgi:hypothetical protein
VTGGAGLSGATRAQALLGCLGRGRRGGEAGAAWAGYGPAEGGKGFFPFSFSIFYFLFLISIFYFYFLFISFSFEQQLAK